MKSIQDIVVVPSDLTVEELYNEMMNYPHVRHEYDSFRRLIHEKLLEESKYNENILCFNSGLTFESVDRTFDRLFNTNGCMPTKNGLLHDPKSFPEKFGNELKILPRNKVEYNIDYKQLCVGVIIKHDKNYVVLENTELHRLSNKVTMIQGHVDYSGEMYRTTMLDYLKRTVYKELQEEVKGFEDIPLDKMLLLDRLIINDKFGDATSLEHVGVIFELYLPVTFDISTIITREPEKHNVKVYSLEELQQLDTLDRWFELALPNLK